MKALHRVNDVIAGAIRWIVVAMVSVMLVVLAFQVLMRYAFTLPLSWSEELAVGLFAWSAMLMAAVGIREGFHVRMSIVIQRLPPGARLWFEQAIHLLSFVIGCFLAWSGWSYFDGTRGATSASMGYPVELLHASVPVCGVLIALFALESLLERRIPPDESAGDEIV